MKKLLICLLMILSLGLFGCGEEEPKQIEIITTIFPIYDFTREIKTEDINLTMLLSPGQEVHTYDPSAKDIVKINSCDLFIYIGGESDAWVEDIIASIENENFKALKLMDFVEGICEEDHDHSVENHVDEYDEHIWTSPKNAIIMVEEISKAIEPLLEDKTELVKNTNAYIEKLEQLDKSFEIIVSAATENTLVFGDRFPFLYFAHDYNLECYKAFPGCSSETEASQKTIKELVDIVKEKNLKYVFYIEMSNQNVARAICADTGAEPLLFHSCQTVSLDDFNNGASYISLMQGNLVSLQRGLGL